MSVDVPFRRLIHEVDVRGESEELELLSVSISRGVVPRSELTDADARADDLALYKICRPGDIVLNRMRAFQGAVGISDRAGLVSPDYAVLRPVDGVSGLYLSHVLRSTWFVGQMTARLRGIGSPTTGAVRTPRVNIDSLGDIFVPMPSADEQRRIADFLDDKVSRIDAVVAARRRQGTLVDDAFDRIVLETVGGRHIPGARRPSGLRWLGSVPSEWPVLAVSSQFETVLGKMLDERQQTGDHPLPYLRNTNVQWDRIETHDLKVMDIALSEYARCTVRVGDLLICEGGQPGRAAIWDGSIKVIGFQKALHRARTRGRSNPRWLLHCLRGAVAINAFGGENGVTTIGHLTGQQLREQRFPFPEPDVQRRLIDELDDAMARRDALKSSLVRSAQLLAEYKQSLITAAVSGEFDVVSASNRSIPT